MNAMIVETGVSILTNLIVALLGVAGAWLVAQIGKNEKLKTIKKATEALTGAAEQTVWELQQTVVDDLKAASADGKLTKEEINMLAGRLYESTIDKMSESSLNVLQAAKVDINAIITGAAEALIAKIKETYK